MENNTAEESAPPSPAAAPPAEELLKKIEELEIGHATLKQEISNFITSSTAEIVAADHRRKQRSHSISPQRWRTDGGDGRFTAVWKKRSASRHSSPLQRASSDRDLRRGGRVGGGGPAAVKLPDNQYLNILQSMGQSVHIIDLNYRIIYWSRSAENLYGYSGTEALGKYSIELLSDRRDFAVASNIVNRVASGEGWTGQFPVKTKRGDRFLAAATNTPLYDDDGTLVGIICVSSDSKPFEEANAVISELRDLEKNSIPGRTRNTANSATKVSNKVKSKMRQAENNIDREGGSSGYHHSDHVLSDDATSSEANTPRADVHPTPFGVFSGVSHDENSPGKPSRDSGDESEGKPGISRILSSKAEAWIAKKGLSWPFGWPWSPNDQENELGQQKSYGVTLVSENQVSETNSTANNEASGSWSSSFNVNSTSSVSSSGSTSSSAVNKFDVDSDCMDYEISWEDLTIGEQIGQGSCGTVYHGLWYGSVCSLPFPWLAKNK
ncbi:hypothetical protein PHJA_002929500 [Phtheirospermum japonicum]|uniref:PAS domain-containing protein n=1 Tax=Phtheirospermum japonicum TaxID=374723 RepID=A0A830DI02_9LAMI|nr:hypothetical protein PHJA_002929500 [Phtheirospermum japonicum]